MTKPVDLDALDDAHAALGKILPDYWQEDGGDATLAVIRTIYEEEAPPRGDDEESDAPWYWARNEAGWIATKAVEILNAYPAMAAELRALREVAEAAREVAGYHRVYGTETIQDVNVDALRAALAKVPR
jgi:hypothetical protein